MPKRLSQAQLDSYRNEGFAFPVDVLSPEEVRRARAGLEAWEAQSGRPLAYPEKSAAYLLFDWADALAFHPAVLDAVEDLIGPDILVYHSTIFVKEANAPAFVHWHQDGAYFFLEPPEQVTAWIALSEASVRAGCMRIIPGSHRGDWLEHRDDPSPDNMIPRGQGVLGRHGPEDGVLMPLAAGQMSLHHTKALHASGPNANDDRRIGVNISFIPAHVRPLGAPRPSALLARGTDQHGHFAPEQRLQGHLSAQARAAHAEHCRLFRARQDSGFSAAAAG
ncbi:MAG: phytanoyl-CoA dioxygenase family protein [Alphaproteobacteria bacterium]|nr:phytanoyl-CoA dioxygenase family protein [Alphaproteobacteria bacterium]